MNKVLGWVLGIGTIFGAIYLWWSKRNDISDLKTALQVQKIKEAVAKSEAQLEEKLADVETTRETIAHHETVIALAKATAVELASPSQSLSGKSDQEIADIFRRRLR